MFTAQSNGNGFRDPEAGYNERYLLNVIHALDDYPPFYVEAEQWWQDFERRLSRGGKSATGLRRLGAILKEHRRRRLIRLWEANVRGSSRHDPAW